MKKFSLVKDEKVIYDLEAEEMRIEGAAAVFTNAREDELRWNVLVIPLWTVDRISQYADE